MKYCIAALLLICCCMDGFSQTARRPKLGLTLSGGGAKGLAHIGILKAIDSAGLQIDYVTGTSMGSILGALYACGYPADSIEHIARSVNWDVLLSNSASLRSLNMDEKSEYDRYAIELPWVNNGFRFPSGLLESEELWLKFSELFFPMYNVKDFNRFPRPFKCIATDVANGEPVVLDSGEISAAVRSSMSIPSVFTAVEYDGRKLVDGGIVRNFPVKDVKRMGADYVIGSSVSGSLLTKEKIQNVFQILLQIAFFREDEDSKQEKKLCDLYIHHDLDNYSMGSFSSADAIIDEGLAKGRALYPVFKHLADSLNAIYGAPPKSRSLPQVDSIKITQYTINGLKKIEPSFFMHRLQFRNNKWYTAKKLSELIRRAFGTRYFNKITYTLQPLPDGSARIVFDIVENPLTFAKLGIYYDSFAGFSLITNLTTRNFFTPYSRSMVTANLGDNLRIRGEHIQYFGKYKTFSSALSLQLEQFSYSTYDHFNKDGLYKRGYLLADFSLRVNPALRWTTGIGTRFEAFHYKPDIPSKQLELRGNTNFFNTYYFFKHNTLSNNIFPKSGLLIDIEAGYIYSQANNLRFYSEDKLITNTDSLGFSFRSFGHAMVNILNYTPITRKLTFIQQGIAAANTKGGQNTLNDYAVGGLSGNFRNQVPFAGLYVGGFRTSSLAELQLGLRFEMYNNFYLTARSNALYHDFIYDKQKQRGAGFLTGYALSAGYNFILGPLEISAIYSDQSKRLLPYVTLGLSF